jgi:O-acetylhomoserine (thiol)-lyase
VEGNGVDETESRGYGFETLCIHGGQAPDPTTGARAVPIYQTSSFVFQSSDHAAQLFNLDEPGNIYSRIGNPTVDVFEKRMALLEGGVAAVGFASGQAALTATLLTLLRPGDEIVASSHLYGGTHTLLNGTISEIGIAVHFVDSENADDFRRAMTPRTRLVLAETIGNPNLDVLDIRALADIAHEHGAPLLVDNTFATPFLCRPIEHGADIVYHSATKWIGGHGTSIGGVVVDGGRFDWMNGNFPGLSEPDANYHGIVYASEFGTLAFATKLRVRTLRDTGGSMSAFNAFLFLLGLETLPVRMRSHCANALAVARFLADHPAVAWVRYPGLESHPTHARTERYLPHGAGAVVAFGIRGGRAAGAACIDRLALWSHLANVGDVRSLVIHPASTTHQQLSDEDLERGGVAPDLIRLAVGLEDTADLIADLDRALRAATGLASQGPAPLNDEGVIRSVSGDPFDYAGGRPRPKVIAVVGLSANPGRPSTRVARKLQRLGYRVVPINPNAHEILGEKAYPSLADVPFPVDVVQVFRAASAAPGLAREVPEGRARVFWLQEGVVSEEAAAIARERGFEVVMNRCIYKEVQRLRGSLATFPREEAPPVAVGAATKA